MQIEIFNIEGVQYGIESDFLMEFQNGQLVIRYDPNDPEKIEALCMAACVYMPSYTVSTNGYDAEFIRKISCRRTLNKIDFGLVEYEAPKVKDLMYCVYDHVSKNPIFFNGTGPSFECNKCSINQIIFTL